MRFAAPMRTPRPASVSYRALDRLHEQSQPVLDTVGAAAREGCTPDELQLLLMDTTSTYTESDQVVNDPPMRMRGHSKDHRPHEPQVKIGLVTTATGRVVHAETTPGQTSDQAMTVPLALAARSKLPGLPLAMVMDSGMASAKNLAALDAVEPPVHRVSAVPLRNSRFAEDHLLARPGRWARHPDRPGFGVRAARISAEESPSGRAEWWIATRNEAEARRQKRRFAEHEAEVRQALAAAKERGPGCAVLSAYDAQYGIEADFRQLKGPVKLRPMLHRAARRIRAHVVICVLALMVLRELERRAGCTLAVLRKTIGRQRALHIE